MKKNGFTLAEVLIALAIVAVVAVFTIPKVLNSTKNSDEENWKRKIKETLSLVQAAYGQYKLDNRTMSTSFHLQDATPYLNYIRQDSVSQIDGTTCFGAPIACSNVSSRCYLMANGAMLHWYPAEYANGTGSLNAIKWRIDPDGKVTGPAGQDPGKAVVFYTYYLNGKTRDRGNIDANTTGNSFTESPSTACDPNWWSWN